MNPPPDELEHREFLKAIRQPLIIQTPLQTLFETMYNRMQAQMQGFSELREKMERSVRNDLSADELLTRIQLLEDTVRVLSSRQVSPSDQQNVLKRLDAVEVLMHKTIDMAEAARKDVEDLHPRMARVEKKLQGVYNLAGKLAAVEEMAEELGIEIADLETASTASMKMGAAISAASFAAKLKKGGKLASLQQDLADMREKKEELDKVVSEVQAQAEELNGKLENAAQLTVVKIEETQAMSISVQQQLMEEIAALRKDMGKGRDAHVTYADLTRVQSMAEAATRQASNNTQDITVVKETELPAVKQQLQQIHENYSSNRLDAPISQLVLDMRQQMDDIKSQIDSGPTPEDLQYLFKLVGELAAGKHAPNPALGTATTATHAAAERSPPATLVHGQSFKGFLPRLEGFTPSHPPDAIMAPGMMTAEFRRQAEERIRGAMSTAPPLGSSPRANNRENSPPRPANHFDVVPFEDETGLHSNTVKYASPGAIRAKTSLNNTRQRPPSSQNSGQPRTPIFLV